MNTFLIILGSIVALLLLVWWIYRTVRISLCCGTCGCNLISEEQKKKMLARREKRAKRKNVCKTCPKGK